MALQIPAGSFPSGHALNLTAIFGFLIYLVLILVRNRRAAWGLVVLLALPILTAGFARIEDGAHWPSDVLGGYMAGAPWLALTIQLHRRANQRLAGSHGQSGGETPASRRGTVGVGITDRRML